MKSLYKTTKAERAAIAFRIRRHRAERDGLRFLALAFPDMREAYTERANIEHTNAHRCASGAWAQRYGKALPSGYNKRDDSLTPRIDMREAFEIAGCIAEVHGADDAGEFVTMMHEDNEGEWGLFGDLPHVTTPRIG